MNVGFRSRRNDNTDSPAGTYPAGEKVKVGDRVLWSVGAPLVIDENGNARTRGDLHSSGR
jgi:hypothetical protein